MTNLFLLLFIAFFAPLIDAQSISCEYYLHVPNGYSCNLTIDNSDGFDNFASILGTHLDGYSNLDVKRVDIIAGKSPIIPQKLCSHFFNTKYFYSNWIDIGLSEITANSFSECSTLNRIQIKFFNGSIDANSFTQNTKLQYFYLQDGFLSSVPESLFNSCPNLAGVGFYGLQLTSIPPNIFANNPKLQIVYFHTNQLTIWHAEWLNAKPITRLYFYDNKFTSIPINAINSSTLHTLTIYGNPFEVLDARSFGDLSSLTYLDIKRCNLSAVDRGIFDMAQDLTTVYAANNVCVNKNFGNFKLNRESNVAEFEGCFEAFEGGLEQGGEVYLNSDGDFV